MTAGIRLTALPADAKTSEPKVVDEQLLARAMQLVAHARHEIPTDLLARVPPRPEPPRGLEVPVPRLAAPKVDDAEARRVVAALRGRRCERPRLDHDVAHVERALHDLEVVQAQDQREALRPAREKRSVGVPGSV